MKTKITAILITIFSTLFTSNKATAQIGNLGLMYQGAFNNTMSLTTKSAIERGMKNKQQIQYTGCLHCLHFTLLAGN